MKMRQTNNGGKSDTLWADGIRSGGTVLVRQVLRIPA